MIPLSLYTLFIVILCICVPHIIASHRLVTLDYDKDSENTDSLHLDWPQPINAPKKGYWYSAGNHRFVINATFEFQIPTFETQNVTITVPWRRIDPRPLHKDSYITSARTGNPVSFCELHNSSASADNATFTFVADDGPGIYYLYFLPFYTCEYTNGACPYGQGSHQVWYTATKPCTVTESIGSSSISNGSMTAVLQSRTLFESYDPMQKPMTTDEKNAFVMHALADLPLSFSTGTILVTENRKNPIRMTDHFPEQWYYRDVHTLRTLSDNARPGENYTFQVAVFSSKANVNVTDVLFSVSPSVHNARCMNLMGTDFWGSPMRFNPISVPRGKIKTLWMAMEVSKKIPADFYTIEATINLLDISTGATEQHQIKAILNISGPVIPNGGDDDLYRGTRLQWLDSTIGLGSDSVPSPYTPLVVSLPSSSNLKSTNTLAATMSILGKEIVIGTNGLPQSITTTPNTKVLADPVDLYLHDLATDTSIKLLDWHFHLDFKSPVKAIWTATGKKLQSNIDPVVVTVHGSVDCTGYIDYSITLSFPKATTIAPVLVVPANPTFGFAMGFGHPGGFIERLVPSSSKPLTWKWDGVNGNNGMWIGGTSGGVRIFLKGSDPMWQAGVPFDSKKSPPPPESWSNKKNGGARLHKNRTFQAFTGSQVVNGNLTLLFSILVTPVRPLNLTKSWGQRWVQLGYTANSANYSYLSEQGATIVNLHQGNPINPWINYPYLTNDKMMKLSKTCHELNMQFSIYNTMRELSNRCMEIFAMLSFGETFVPGLQGGTDWLQEHLGSYSYSPAWSTPLANFEEDAAIRTKALSRWNNYYVKGMHQMKRDFNMDGIYLDEIAYDRVTLLRARNMLGESGVVDHHSDDEQFESSPAMNYMELYPFIDRLWYGEGFKYVTSTADYWLVEISGIPFGLTSDMLRYPGMTPFHFKGFVFGSSNRWQSGLEIGQERDEFRPTGLWALWKNFGIEKSKMYGWWLEIENGSGSIPVNTTVDGVKVTSYVRKGSAALIALASFAQKKLTGVILNIDFDFLGLDPAHSVMSVPEIIPFQNATRSIPFNYAFEIPKGQGWILLLESKS